MQKLKSDINVVARSINFYANIYLYKFYIDIKYIDLAEEGSGRQLAICRPDSSQFLAEHKKVNNQPLPC